MECDKLCHSNQDGTERDLYTSSIFRGNKFDRCLGIPTFFLDCMIFSLRCFSKDNFQSSIRPKGFCSFTFPTTVLLDRLKKIQTDIILIKITQTRNKIYNN
jgi:hypothetical protein